MKPEASEDPFFRLLEDDHLVVGVRARTEQLLEQVPDSTVDLFTSVETGVPDKRSKTFLQSDQQNLGMFLDERAELFRVRIVVHADNIAVIFHEMSFKIATIAVH